MLNKKVSAGKSAEKGFTIFEMMIAMVIFLVATAAVFGIMRLASIQKSTANTRTDQLRSARIAMEYIRRDALNAGFGFHRAGGNVPDDFGGNLFTFPKDGDSQRDLLTSVIGGNNITDNTLNSNTKMDFVGFISRDPTFNSGNLISYTKTYASGDKVLVDTPDGAATNCKKHDLYLLESDSGTTQVIGMATNVTNNKTIELAVNDPLKVNQSATSTGENKSLLMTTTGSGTIKKINFISYGISSKGVLVRKTYGNRTGETQQIEERELVYGVSDFQIKYFMEDGTTIDDPSSNNNGRDNQIKMNGVVQIQITITITPHYEGNEHNYGSPVTLREFISTKNLRYEAS